MLHFYTWLSKEWHLLCPTAPGLSTGIVQRCKTLRQQNPEGIYCSLPRGVSTLCLPSTETPLARSEDAIGMSWMALRDKAPC